MKVKHIELLGEQHPMCLSLTATEELCEEFGDLSAMADSMTAGDMITKVKAIDKVLAVLLKAGRTYVKGQIYMTGADIPLPKELPGRPADFIDVSDPQVVQTIMAAIAGDSDRTVETETKNGEATQEP